MRSSHTFQPRRASVPAETTVGLHGREAQRDTDPRRKDMAAHVVGSRRLNVDAEGAFDVIDEALSLGRELWLEASGESMYPVLPSGSRVLIVTRRRPARRGDVVLVRRGQRLILHRVRSVDENALVTQGDACPEPDPSVASSRAIGLAVACDDGRGIRPIALAGRWYGFTAAVRWVRVEAHRVLRGWRR